MELNLQPKRVHGLEQSLKKLIIKKKKSCLPIMIIVLNMTRILILIIWCGTKGDHFSFKWEIFCSNHFFISIFVF